MSATTTRLRHEPCWLLPPALSASTWCTSHTGLCAHAAPARSWPWPWPPLPQPCPTCALGTPRPPALALRSPSVPVPCVSKHCLPLFPVHHTLPASSLCPYILQPHIPWTPKSSTPTLRHAQTEPWHVLQVQIPALFPRISLGCCSCPIPAGSPALRHGGTLPSNSPPSWAMCVPARVPSACAVRALLPACGCGQGQHRSTEPALLPPAWPTSCTSPPPAMATARGATSSWRALGAACPAVPPCPAAPASVRPLSTWWGTCCRASVSLWLPPSSTSRCLGWTPLHCLLEQLPQPHAGCWGALEPQSSAP